MKNRLSFLPLAGLMLATLLPCSLFAEQEKERYDFIEQSFRAEQSHAKYYYYGWMTIYGVNAAYSFYDAGTTKNTVNHIVGGVSGTQALIGMIGLALSPLPATDAYDTLHAMPGETDVERTERLRSAEELLRKSAEVEREGRSWIMHAANFVVAVGGAAVIRYSYGDRINRAGGSAVEQANINFWSSFLVGELQLFTQPTRSIDSLKEYEQNYGVSSVSVAPCVTSDGAGVAFVLRF